MYLYINLETEKLGMKMLLFKNNHVVSSGRFSPIICQETVIYFMEILISTFLWVNHFNTAVVVPWI